MTSPRQAFETALALNLVGVFFDTAAVLTNVRGYADGALAERVGEQAGALKAHRSQARANIERVQAAMAPAEMPTAPDTPEGYGDWAQACSAAVYDGLEGDAITAYMAGWWLGGWLLAGNLVALTLYLGDAAPTDPYLAEVLTTYTANAQAAAAGLDEVLAGAEGPLLAGLTAAREALLAAPSPGLGDGALDAAGGWQEALEQLDTIVQQTAASIG
jgi:hypothetical protein